MVNAFVLSTALETTFINSNKNELGIFPTHMVKLSSNYGKDHFNIMIQHIVIIFIP